MNTLPRSDEAIAANLKYHETRCTFLPQVYSGAAYDFCRLHAEYKGRPPIATPTDPIVTPIINDRDGKFLAVLLATDFVLSGVIDTLALPYAIYKQNKVGSVELD